jgi:hypothetical protein
MLVLDGEDGDLDKTGDFGGVRISGTFSGLGMWNLKNSNKKEINND